LRRGGEEERKARVREREGEQGERIGPREREISFFLFNEIFALLYIKLINLRISDVLINDKI